MEVVAVAIHANTRVAAEDLQVTNSGYGIQIYNVGSDSEGTVHLDRATFANANTAIEGSRATSKLLANNLRISGAAGRAGILVRSVSLDIERFIIEGRSTGLCFDETAHEFALESGAFLGNQVGIGVIEEITLPLPMERVHFSPADNAISIVNGACDL